MTKPLLDVRDLRVRFHPRTGPLLGDGSRDVLDPKAAT